MHTVNVNGANKELSNIYTNIGGVWKEYATGYDCIGGAWKEFPSSGTPVSTLAKDTSVYVNMDGVPCEWYIVYQGNPNTSLYDSSCNGTWLIPNSSLEQRQWNSTLHNDYENSDIHKYLNGDFLNKFDSGFRNIIKQVKIPYRPGSGNSSTVLNGSSGLSTKLFLPSSREWSVGGVNGTPNIGAGLGIYKKGEEEVYWLRSPYFYKNNYTAWYTMPISSYGPGAPSDDVTSIKGLRPLMIIPSDTMVDDNMNILA